MSPTKKTKLLKIVEKSFIFEKKTVMTKEEFLKLAEARYDQIHKLNEGTDFYNYEKEFVLLWQELGRQVIEKNLSKVGNDRRKKKDTNKLRDNRSE